MRIVAIVPARGGSKAIKHKNIIDLNDKPLIYYVINALLQTPEIADVIVSTDCDKIKDTISSIFPKRLIIIDRPPELSDDNTTSEDAIEHVLHNLKGYTHAILAQCTSPFTKSSDFSMLIKKIKEGYDTAAFYVNCHSYFFDLEEDQHKLRNKRLPRQIKTPRKKEVGNGWIFNIDGFLKHKSRLFGNIGLCKIESLKELEIDTINDLLLAKTLFKLKERECITSNKKSATI